MQREGKPAYISIIVEAFAREQNSGSHQQVCQEIADRGKKLFYEQDTPKVTVLCALVERKGYSLDKRVKNLHSDYYEFACGNNYLVVTKQTRQYTEEQKEETKFMATNLQSQAIAFAESKVL